MLDKQASCFVTHLVHRLLASPESVFRLAENACIPCGPWAGELLSQVIGVGPQQAGSRMARTGQFEDTMKRCFDLVLSLAGLLVLMPLLLILWIAIVFGTGRPGFFCQTRVGRRGRDFTLYKFRTMTLQRGAEEGSFEAGSVSRVTPIGRVLRRTKLDELPQLWNVCQGDMALVGPRPEVRRWVEACPDRWTQVLTVRPGITDPASIEFRNEEETLAASADPESTYANEILPRKLALYEEYVREQSLRLDLGILLRTFLTVIKG